MTPYIHRVQYYETDKMGITHHSNYIRWMEEARIAYLEQLGYPFAKLEEMGVASPVLGVSCDYKKSTTFSDEVSILVSVKEFKGVKLHLAYEMRDAAGDVVCVGTTSHAFFNLEGRPLRMKQEYPDLYGVLMGELEK